MTIDLKSCGIGQEQGGKIISLLHEVLKNQDLATINAKLDQLLDLASKPTSQQNCIGSACALGPGSQATFNQYGDQKKVLSPEQLAEITSAMRPFASEGKPTGDGTFTPLDGLIECVSGNVNSCSLAAQLADAFRKAGWNLGKDRGYTVGVLGTPSEQVAIICTTDYKFTDKPILSNRGLPPGAFELATLLLKDGIDVAIGPSGFGGMEEFRIYVGTKP